MARSTRKTFMTAIMASALVTLIAACGSDSDGGAAAPADTPVPSTSTPGPAATPEPAPATPSPGSGSGETDGPADYDALVRALVASGVDAPGTATLFPATYFGVQARSINVGGEQDALVPALVFAFTDAASRAAAQSTVDLNAGTIGGEPLDDAERTVLFGAGNLILLYQGPNEATVESLTAIMGAPFARGSGDGPVDPSASARKTVEAPIESVDLVFMESDPLRVTAKIMAALPNGCHQRGEITTHRAGDVFGVTVLNTVPALDGVFCTQQFSTYDVTVPLGVDDASGEQTFLFRPGVTYRLVVNDRLVEFTTDGVRNENASPSAYDTLTLALARQGVTPQPTDETIAGVFGLDARLVRIGDAEVQVHDFGSEALASSAASAVSPDGGALVRLDGAPVSVVWAAPPHFFRAGGLIVLYVGEGEDVLRALAGAIGQSFAGAPIAIPVLPPPTPSPDGQVPFPSPTQPAPVESVEVAVLESFPIQYALRIVAGLENSCIEPHSVQAVAIGGGEVPPDPDGGGGNVVNVAVLNRVGPPGTVCAEVYRTYEKNIDLGANFVSGSEWDVVVNGRLMASFTAR